MSVVRSAGWLHVGIYLLRTYISNHFHRRALPELRIQEQDALRHPWLAQSDSDRFFTSSIEVGDDLAQQYQQIAQKYSSGADGGDGSWQEVVADSEGEEEEEEEGNAARRRKSESFEWNEEDRKSTRLNSSHVD